MEENALVEKILSDIENVLDNDTSLQEFDFVPIPQNDTNKSPVLHENNNLGLEVWCVKHILSYTHSYLLKIRKTIKKVNNESELKRIRHALLGAALVQPDVATFWNMRRELLEIGLLDPRKEFCITSLVLSRKSKCNEAFAHRRWIIKKGIANNNEINGFFLSNAELLVCLDDELSVAEMASRKAQNNYHAWNHRLWILEHWKVKYPYLLPVMLAAEFNLSTNWVYSNVSEHSAFHYRQRLISCISSTTMGHFFVNYKQFIVNYFKLNTSDLDCFLPLILCHSNNVSVRSYCTISLLFFELYHTLEELNNNFCGHEAIWYHRRFIVYSLLNEIFSLFGVSWSFKKIIASELNSSENIVSKSLNELLVSDFDDSGEKNPKLLKADFTLMEDSILFKEIIRRETALMNSSTNDSVQSTLVTRYKKWFYCILQMNRID